MSINFIWPVDRTLSRAPTPGQSGPGIDCNERVLHILQSSSITGTSPSDYFVSYPGHLFGELYPSVEMQSSVFHWTLVEESLHHWASENNFSKV